MATDNRISVFIKEQFPDFIKDSGPLFIDFMEAYYEWMEQDNFTIDVSRNLLNYQDIDESITKYFEFLKREVLSSIPKEILFDQRLFAKQAKELYRARGSEKSYRFLFRAIYNEEINFYYPGQDMLRASDGRWVKETSIRLSAPFVGNINDLAGELVTGKTSGATARVDRIIRNFESGLEIFELFLLDIAGEFQDEEIVCNSDDTASGSIYALTGPLQNVNIVSGGAFHTIGDSVTLTGQEEGTGAVGIVTETSDTSAVRFFIEDGGFGYTVPNNDIRVFGGSGFNADWQVTAISNTAFIDYRYDIIHPMRNVLLNTDPQFQSGGLIDTSLATPSANLQSANVNTMLDVALGNLNLEVGRISEITTTNYGYGYQSVPSTTVENIAIREFNIDASTIVPWASGILGRNADIRAINVPGAITEVAVTNFGNNYRKNTLLDIVNTSSFDFTFDALGTPIVEGFINYPGRYTDTLGWLSWNNRLQDNRYYQEFSYEIISEQLTRTYRKIVEDLLHPAGVALFGRVLLLHEEEAPLSPGDGLIFIPTYIQQLDQPASINTCVDLTLKVTEGDAGAMGGCLDSVFYDLTSSTVASPTDIVEANLVSTAWLTGSSLMKANTDNIMTNYESLAMTDYEDAPVDYLGTLRLMWTDAPGEFTDTLPIPSTTIRISELPTVNDFFTTTSTYSNTYVLLQTAVPGALNGATYTYPQLGF